MTLAVVVVSANVVVVAANKVVHVDLGLFAVILHLKLLYSHC